MRRTLPTLCEGGFVERAENLLAFGLPGRGKTHLVCAIGHELAKRAAFGDPWGCVYRVVGERVFATLYSIGDLDVAQVATQLGGGGHRNAAGFSVSLPQWLEMQR